MLVSFAEYDLELGFGRCVIAGPMIIVSRFVMFPKQICLWWDKEE
jgi:hypothetical protein